MAAQKALLEEAARQSGLDVVPLARDVNVTETIRSRMREGQKLFIAAGGDGTIHHVDATARELGSEACRHPRRYLQPLRQGPRDSARLARGPGRVADGVERRSITARVNDRFFVNNVSMGLYPELVARREAKGRDYPRWKARLYAA